LVEAEVEDLTDAGKVKKSERHLLDSRFYSYLLADAVGDPAQFGL
jgi:hypothetical protein